MFKKLCLIIGLQIENYKLKKVLNEIEEMTTNCVKHRFCDDRCKFNKICGGKCFETILRIIKQAKEDR